MTASTRPTLRLSALLPLLLLWLASSAAALSPQVLLVFDLDDPVSALDARGIREALAEQRTPSPAWCPPPEVFAEALKEHVAFRN
ncbi:MAG: hypothetical protein MEQ07_08105 [Aquimonas sp.]|nr:hypothetical protein [Aquimonas sp.]